MPKISESSSIDDLLLVQLESYSDQRGQLSEIFRKEWFPDLKWTAVQSNHSASKAGVLRGLHYHHHQIDYWYVLKGTIRAGLVDLRASSPTYLKAITLDLNQEMGLGIFIPTGVAHGFFAIEEAAILYFVDKYYSGQDEFGVAWDDPDINLNWGVKTPLLSQRDQSNPPLRDILESDLPG